MIIYNQSDQKWGGKIYSAKPPHTEIISSSGCGPTSVAMIISNLTESVVTPDVMADYSIKNGYRIDGVGTSFGLFFDVAKKYNLQCLQKFHISEAIECVKSGGMVVCSTNGGETGLFSTGGHLLVMSAYNEYLDPGLYNGKYDVSYRKYKANVTTGRVYVAPDVAKRHIASYFCFNKIEGDLEMIYNYVDENMPSWARETVQKLMDKGYLKGNENGELGLNDTMLKLLVINDRAGLYDR